jgi:hypothetical protein
VSSGKKGGRFSYLADATESTQTSLPAEEGRGQENDTSALVEHDDSLEQTDNSGGGGEGRSITLGAQELASVPKGKGRMKQERSQLNVRLPTTLKRQAAAKAVLEGKDIGEVVEELLREYLKKR